MRTPSSLYSTEAGPVPASASSTSGAVDASIGWIATPTASRIAVSARRALGEREAGRRREVAAQHRRPPDERRGHLGRLGHRVGHQAGERPLAELAR